MLSKKSLFSHPLGRALGWALLLAMLWPLTGCGKTDPIIALRDLGADVKRTKERTVEMVRLPESAGDDALAHVAELKTPGAVTTLNLAGTQITDEGLKHLEELTGLETLDLSHTAITDEGLAHLTTLTSLRDLRIGDTQITDEGLLETIPKLARLQILNVAPSAKPIPPEPRTWRSALSFGIDLAGGTNLVYQVDRDAIEQKAREAEAAGGAVEDQETKVTGDVMEQMVAAVSRRLNPSGTEEITVRKVGSDRIEVIIPKASPEEVEQKKRQMTRLGSLEFALLANSRDHSDIYSSIQKLPPGEDLLREDGSLWASWRDVGTNANGTPKDVGGGGEVYQNAEGQFLTVFEPANQRVTGEYLSQARESTDESGRLAVGFTFNTQGGFRFQQLTSQNRPATDGFERRLSILLDNKIHSAPTILTTIGSQGQITGSFTHEEVQELISVLNAGALTVPILPDPISEQSISPLLGEDVQRSGMLAILISGAAVIVFMIGYYLFAGLIATFCLVLNIVLVMGAMALIDATLTLPGLAGIVLTIGMAVDTNVLIFERMREEINRGSSMRLTVQNGFGRAFSAIIDSNLTTLISAVVLYVIGTDQIRGFAVTLFIGIVMSMFTALYFGRMIFDIWERKRWLKKLRMMTILRGVPKIKFIEKWPYAVVFSTVTILAGMGTFILRGNDNFDIDFSGGTMLTFELVEEQEIAEVRKTLEEAFDNEAITLETLSREDLPAASPTEGRLFRVRTIQTDVETVRNNVSQSLAQAGYDLKNVQMSSSDVEPIPPADAAQADLPEQDRALVQLYAGGHRVELTFSDPLTRERITAGFLSALSDVKKPTADGEVESSQAESKYAEPEGLFRVRPKQTQSPTDSQTAPPGEERFTQVTLWTRPQLAVKDLNTALADMRTSLANPQFEGVDSFASSVAGEMKQSAVMAMVISMLAIVAYLWFRFQAVTFGLAAISAVVHDLLFVLGFVAMVSYASVNWGLTFWGLEDFKINLPMIAAYLTIIGYSLNDTIVVFDRVREIRGKNPAMTAEMINTALNQTLPRTLLTTWTTWVVVAILYAIGGAGIHGFAFCLVIGLIIGTYSTLYVAAPVLLWLMHKEHGKSSRAATPAKSKAAAAS